MKARLWAAGVLAAALSAAYAPTLRGGFVFDDHIYVEANPFVAEAANLRYLLDPRFYLHDQHVLAGSRPVFLASLLADRALWGGRPGGYRLTNLVLHGAVAACVGLFALELGLAEGAALLAALLFALQPRLSEAVCSPSFRPDVLAALFAFLALFVLRRAAGRDRRGFLLGAAGAAGLFLLSLMSKESAALVVLGAAAAGPAAPRWTLRRAAAALALLAAVGALYAGFRTPRFRYELVVAPPLSVEAVPAEARLLPPEAPRWQYPPSPPPWGRLYVERDLRAWTMLVETADSVRRLWFPGRPTVDRAPLLRETWLDPPVLPAALFLLTLPAAALFLRRRSPAASAGLVWTVAALLPVCGLAPLYNPVADRYLYLPMAGAAWALAAALSALARRAGPREGAVLGVLGAFVLLPWTAQTRRRAAEWGSDKALFFAEPGDPQGPRVAYNRGVVMLKEGRPLPAEAHLREAVRVHPGFAEAWMKLGALYDSLGAADNARQAFAAGAAAPCPSPLPLFAFGRFLERRGEAEAAAALFRAALTRDPGFSPAAEALQTLKR
ncbi:hypothetical protein EPO15_08010 [bacterium]|nr:MAG: hypothetical protein EPO15_08010 [bacterium]